VRDRFVEQVLGVDEVVRVDVREHQLGRRDNGPRREAVDLEHLVRPPPRA
jgi:hypothetical protein